MIRKLRLQEVDKGYSRQVYAALDDAFTDSYGKVELVYIADAVDMWLFNTQKLYKEIFNNRRKATSIAYEALIDLFQDTVDGYDVKVIVTSEMVKQWFKRVGLNYIDCLKPVVDKIKEEREEARQTKKESIRRPRRRSMRESSDEIARKGFVSLVPDTFNGGYLVLNDGNFVCKISAVDDEDATDKFYRFLKTDWNSAWRDGTLPRYFGESFGEYSSKRVGPYDKTKRWTFSWHVKDNPETYAHNDSMLVLADTEHEAIETAFDRIENEFNYTVADVDYYDVEEIMN